MENKLGTHSMIILFVLTQVKNKLELNGIYTIEQHNIEVEKELLERNYDIETITPFLISNAHYKYIYKVNIKTFHNYNISNNNENK